MQVILILIFFRFCSSIDIHTEQFNYTINPDRETLTIYKNENFKGITELIIPETVEFNGTNYTVTIIGKYGFQEVKNYINDIVIHSTIREIKAYSMRMYHTNGSLIISEGVQKIDEWAFFGAEIQGDLIIPDSVTEINIKVFQDSYFDGKLKISENLKIIQYEVFANTKFGGDIIIPKSVEAILGSAFQNSHFDLT